jgi:5-methylcytosine-specific restriction endonuclease McrA
VLQADMETNDRITKLSDSELIAEAKRLAACERQATTALIRCLMELDARRLYLAQGCSSLFAYCTRVLKLSEHAAYGRIEAARAARRFPCMLEQLDAGAVTLTTITLLAPHLTDENHQAMLDQARHKTKREVEVIAAALRPRPDVPVSVRRVAEPTQAAVHAADEGTSAARSGSPSPTSVSDPPTLIQPPSTRPAVVKPLAPARYVVKLTISEQTHEKLRRAQSLLRHAVPDGNVAEVLDRALTVLLRDLERAKAAMTARPRAGRPVRRHSRYIPAAVRREVWQRDSGRCAFIGPEGRCGEAAFVEFHHRVPFADGGPPTAANLELRCTAHNRHEADRWFGPMMAREPPARRAPSQMNSTG